MQHAPPTTSEPKRKYTVTARYAVLRMVGFVQRMPDTPAKMKHR
jgi:hypothetical protein